MAKLINIQSKPMYERKRDDTVLNFYLKLSFIDGYI